jgi:imidazolonepropionase
MSSRLIYNIRQAVNTRQQSEVLRGAALMDLPSIDNAWIHIEDDRIAACGPMSALPRDLAGLMAEKDAVDAAGCLVLPAWCDSHTHLVFAGSREGEFVDKLNGLSYAEIAARGGGILNSARQVAAASEDALFNQA